MVLTEYAKRIALFEAEGYRPPTIAKMLKSEGIFVSRRGVAKVYEEYTVGVKKKFPCFIHTSARLKKMGGEWVLNGN